MAVIPMGTANDFATSIGLPEDPWEALQLCTMDTAQPIDVGLVNDKVRCRSQSRLFVHHLYHSVSPLLDQGVMNVHP